ncbi:hypothetical protein SNE40_011174 [Patella caerulea]|uniref:Uncharacterized protein n=1 Tax=Patella caerulea TaxID=87958 RepID=A0AAN8JKZ4_PATCE
MAVARKRQLSFGEVLGEIFASSGSDNVDNDVSSLEGSEENDSDEWTPASDRQRGNFHNCSNSMSDSDSSNDVSMQLPGDGSDFHTSDGSVDRDIDSVNSQDDNLSDNSDNQSQVIAVRLRAAGPGADATTSKPALTWYNRDNVPVIHPFTGTPGVNVPLTPQSEIVDIFRAFNPDDLIQDIVRETNI